MSQPPTSTRSEFCICAAGGALRQRRQRSTPRVGGVRPMQTGVIYCGDNLPRLAQLPAESVDLIYLDPPFFSNRQYEVIWGDEAEIRSFEDRWQGGIRVYIEWMRERAIELHRVLKATGSLYLHCDSHASHYLKVMLDEAFGSTNFRNEIIWKRTTAHSDSKQGATHYGRVHDILLFYTKGPKATFNTQWVPYEQSYIESHYRHVEPGTGRRYRKDNITGNKPGGDTSYEWRGVYPYKGRYWIYSKARMEGLEAEGRLIYTRSGMPEYKRYLDEMPGVALQDLWMDIPLLNSQAKERLGYPTQKPESLLERVIRGSSNPGDVVLDPFAGCGTALVVAHQLDRQWVGIDISPTAAEMMRRRMATVGATNVKLVGMPISVDALRRLKPFEFQNWVIQRLNGTHSRRKSGDMGIDGFSFFLHEPIQVKQSDNIGRPVVDNFETAVQRSGKMKGYLIGFSFTKGAYEEVARAKQALGLEIALVKVSDMLRDVMSLIAPVGGRGSLSLPMPPPRPANTLPSADELIRSDLRIVPGRDDDIDDERPLERRPDDSAPSERDAQERGQSGRPRSATG